MNPFIGIAEIAEGCFHVVEASIKLLIHCGGLAGKAAAALGVFL